MLSGMLPMSVSQAAEEGTSVDTQVESVEESVGEVSDADSQTTEETDSTVPLEETEESSQTSAADTASEPQLQYLYVETPYLYAPASQKIAVSFQEGMTLSGQRLHMRMRRLRSSIQFRRVRSRTQQLCSPLPMKRLVKQRLIIC